MNDSELAERRRESLDWLHGRINYERSDPIPYSRRGMKLDRMRSLLERLGAPHAALPIVHVTGTKGKGSTAAMIAGALREAGHRVGVYSSPHLERIEERFAIDAAPCSAETLVALVDAVRPVAEAMDREGAGPTFFDLTTAMALRLFAGAGGEAPCDAAVLEVGLGGRLDSTNVVTPAVAVVTSISLDHTRQLGATRAAIAAEKAGIFKPGVPAVSGVVASDASEVIERTAREAGCPLLRRGHEFDATPCGDGWRFRRATAAGGEERIDAVRPPLPGPAYADNAATAMATLGVLADAGWRAPVDARLRGVRRARLPARMERFGGRPVVVVDGAHNDASAGALADALAELTAPCDAARRVLLVAISEEKDVAAILQPLLPEVGAVVATRYVENPRAIPPERIASLCGPKSVETIDEPVEALRRARALAGAAGAVVVTGSLFLAAEVRPVVIAEQNK